jgi:hypothetical protein
VRSRWSLPLLRKPPLGVAKETYLTVRVFAGKDRFDRLDLRFPLVSEAYPDSDKFSPGEKVLALSGTDELLPSGERG